MILYSVEDRGREEEERETGREEGGRKRGGRVGTEELDGAREMEDRGRGEATG